MEKESLTIKPPVYRNMESLNAPMHIYDLPALISDMKQSHTWSKGRLNTMILLKRPDKQIVLTLLHEGTEINSFQSNDSVTFQIIEGKLMFQARERSVTLDKGQLLTLRENINYCLTTVEDTAFLLTIENGALQRAEN